MKYSLRQLFLVTATCGVVCAVWFYITARASPKGYLSVSRGRYGDRISIQVSVSQYSDVKDIDRQNLFFKDRDPPFDSLDGVNLFVGGDRWYFGDNYRDFSMKNGGEVTEGMREKYRLARELIRAYRPVGDPANDPPHGEIEVKYDEARSLFFTDDDLPDGVVVSGINVNRLKG